MARPKDRLAELLKLPMAERAKAARALLDSLDEDYSQPDADVKQAQTAELMRRIGALDAGDVKLIESAEARARVMARVRSFRGQ